MSVARQRRSTTLCQHENPPRPSAICSRDDWIIQAAS